MNDNEAPIIMFDKVSKWYGQFHVLRDIELRVAKGERIVICGPSGSGKSTLIRCVNRLEEHQQGKLVVDGIELTDDVKAIDAVRRNVGMVFQQFNLFPHLTVLENLTLAPMWVGKMPKKEAEDKAMTQWSGKQPRCTARRQSFARQPERIAHGHPEEHAAQSIGVLRRRLHVSFVGHDLPFAAP